MKYLKYLLLLLLLPSTPIHAVKTRLTWVNGIGHNRAHMEEGKESMTHLFGGKPVYYCHNPTAMNHDEDYVGFLGDLTQAGTQKLGRITSEVDELVKHLKDAVESVGRKGRVVHIAHSQGALITYLAARRLSPSEMSKIEVLCFGGAAALRRSEFPFHRVVNYYAVNDPLLHVVPSAVKALRSGFLSSYQEQSDPEFVFLSPRSGDPVQDHMLFGPTYGPALEWEGHRYQQTYINPLSRTYRKSALITQSSCAIVLEWIRIVFHLTIYKMCIYCMYFYEWQRDTLLLLKNIFMIKVLQPILIMMYELWAVVRELVRRWTEGNEKYEPLEPLSL